MNEHICEREQEVAAAASGGSCDSALLDHARNCPVCSEVLLIAKLLAKVKRLSAQEVNGVPDAGAVWRKARALAREQALRRATRPIRTARIAAFAVGAFVVPLLIPRFRWLRPYMPDLWPRHVLSPYQPWFAGSSASLLMLAIGAAIILIGMSSWYMVREE
jgi:hypothetical protein